MNPEDTCVVKLQAFEGPLDLLLHLIKKNEVNIYDIPVALITEQYIDYLNLMRVLNLEIVGDYLKIAAELGFIKSKTLLPTPDEGQQADEEDPREELVRRLLEYRRFKDAASSFYDVDTLDRDVFIRDVDQESDEQNVQLLKVDLWALIEAFREVYNRKNYKSEERINFDLEKITLEQRVDQIISELKLIGKTKFDELFDGYPDRFHIVITFLAILELIKNEIISAYQDSPNGQINLVYSGEKEDWTINI